MGSQFIATFVNQAPTLLLVALIKGSVYLVRGWASGSELPHCLF